MTVQALELLRDCLSRCIAIREELDPIARDQMLADLEGDLAGGLAGLEALLEQERQAMDVAA